MIRTAFLLALLCGLLVDPALAVSDPRELIPDHTQEMRAEAIGHRLRCLVCQNKSVEDWDSGVAGDLRRAIRKRVEEGASDQQVIAWMVARYGDFIRLRPPFGTETLLLWLSPVFALVTSCVIVLMSRRRVISPAAALTTEELGRLAKLGQL